MEKFLSAFGAERVEVVPQSKKLDQISAARKVIKRAEFHRDRCEAGLDGLLAWEFEWIDDNNVFSKAPLHNWASHPGDAFAYGAQVMEQYIVPEKKKDEPRYIGVGEANTATLDDLWKLERPQPRRI
jgi:phage terminase large subunit